MTVQEKAKSWLSDAFDPQTRAEVQELLDGSQKAIEDAFYKELEFGTGGMRGIMGVGTNRINKYTLGAATQGLANYLIEVMSHKTPSVAIAYDVRHNSQLLATTVAEVLSANGVKAYLFEGHRPTPELSFAVRHLSCDAGIVLTASHNPPEYNGYKVYWADGAQVVPPHDKGIIDRVRSVRYDEILFEPNSELIETIGSEIDEAFWNSSLEHSGYQTDGRNDLKIVFTPIHGTSAIGIPQVLAMAGFTHVHLVEEQMEPDGDFSTVRSPNPEEKDALQLALNLADEVGADILIGTDPDADRLGIGVRDDRGQMVLLNGNQTNIVLTDYLLHQWQEKGKLKGNEFIGSTIVTSDIMFEIAQLYGVECKAVLTGFKWIGKLIADSEGREKFVCGGEESYGFMVDDFVRDKDSVTSALIACEVAAHLKAKGSSFYQALLEVYKNTHCYQESLFSITKKGKSGAEEIKTIMENLRSNPVKELAGSPVRYVYDYLSSECTDTQTSEKSNLDLPKANVLIFYAEDGTRVAVRPSGTEPKIKFYFSTKAKLAETSDYQDVRSGLLDRLSKLESIFGSLS